MKLADFIHFIRMHPDEKPGRIISVSTSNHLDLKFSDGIDNLYQHVNECLLCKAEVMARSAVMGGLSPEEGELRQKIKATENISLFSALVFLDEVKSEFLRRVGGLENST